MIDRAGLADFLRRRRDALRPEDVGLPPGFRRRAPGLRREEVAQLAGMSTDYYARLEQQRGAHPSAQIVASLARALRLELDERDHLYHLADLTPPARRAGRHIGPGLLALADRLTDVPLVIATDVDEVLWQNTLADAVLGHREPGTGRESNITWRWFAVPGSRDRFPGEHWSTHSAAHVADLRATHARRAGDPDVVELVNDLLERSAEFRRLWERHEVAVRRHALKSIVHPEVGLLELTCEILFTPEEDLRIRAFLPVEGTDAREKLELLRVIGTQSFEQSGT
ncbi:MULTISPECIES: helix-turn-helix transcriptional regulator [unclassified Nocardioides]|uniref:helix-turn-helix transcriptional regulator n=1 Tax=unclassified Nocardioides TaxID=2615069 RepID=UPI00129731D6|nr:MULTISPECIES: helix-turn-helix transcriptional regulator [unclassified Nocardioides]